MNRTAKIDDAKVRWLITRSIEEEPKNTTENINTVVLRVFRKMQKLRQTSRPDDYNLAAAEHYMYMRALAGKTGDPLLSHAPWLYNFKKWIFFSLGIQEKMQVTKYPPVPPSDKIVKWGKQGVADGIEDYKTINPEDNLAYGQALAILKTEAHRGYSYQQNPNE